MIVIKNLSFAYKEKWVLHQLNTHIKEGDFYAIVGANGSGKTTLLKTIGGLLPTKESIWISNIAVDKIKTRELAKKVGYVPQNQDIVFNFSVFESVMMGRNPHQSRWETFSAKDEKIVNVALEKTNLLHLKDKFINQLSGGEQQRVRIARAIAQQTPILLLDEPLSNLDVVHQFEIMDILSELNKNQNITILIVLHNLSMALQYVKQVMMLKNGEILHIGDAKETLIPLNIKNTFGLSEIFSIDSQGNITKNPFSFL